jgi:hypothetical protein
MNQSQGLFNSLDKIYQGKISQEDKISAGKNLSGFMSLLIEIDRQNNSAKK